MKLTAIIHDAENGWMAGQIAEYPAAISQGRSVEELKANLLDALLLLFEVQRDETLAETEEPYRTEALTIFHETSEVA